MRSRPTQVVRAEHPDFEIVSCFRCFNLEEWVDQSAADYHRHGRPDHFDDALARVANSVAVNKDGLINEFFDLGRFARNHFKQVRCSNLDAWSWALRSTSTTEARKRHMASNLEVALAFYACISASDSIIEQNFSRIQHLLGEQRLNAADESESDMVILLVSDPNHDDTVLSHAKDVWAELYGNVRLRAKGRIDRGAPGSNQTRPL